MSSSGVYDHIWFESKRSSSLECCQTFLFFSLLLRNRHRCPQWTGVKLWLLAVMLLYSLIVFIFCTDFDLISGDALLLWKLFFFFPLPHFIQISFCFLFSKYRAPCSSSTYSALLPSPLSPPLMHFRTSYLPQRLSHSTSTLFLCGFQPSK